MHPTTREQRLADVFVTLADTLVNGYDVAGLFDYLAAACVELLDVSAAGLMLADPNGNLRVMAASNEQSRILELMEIQNDAGPCLDCYRRGQAVVVGDIEGDRERWPRFCAEATQVGFGSVYALPMRLREDTLGALNLFHEQAHGVPDTDLRLAQALADVATIAILQQRTGQQSAELAAQLQEALNSRLIIEQAKGVLAEREQTDMVEAFDMLRNYARHKRTKLSDTARAVVAGELGSADMRSAARPKPSQR